MSEHHEQITEASKEVKKYATDKLSPAELKKYATQIGNTADQGANDLKSLKLGPEANKYLNSNIPTVTGYLKYVASKGAQIVKERAADKDKEIDKSHYQTIEDQGNSLKSALAEQKAEITDFVLLEGIQAQNKALDDALTLDYPKDKLTKLITDKKALLKKIPATVKPWSKDLRDSVESTILKTLEKLEAGDLANAVLTSVQEENIQLDAGLKIDVYNDTLDQTIAAKKALLLKIPLNVDSATEKARDTLKQEISASLEKLAPVAALKAKIMEFSAKIDEVEKLVKAHEADPSEETRLAAQEAIAKINVQAVSDELFGKIDVSGLYNDLWNYTFTKIKARFEGLSSQLQTKEKSGNNAEATVVFETSEEAYKTIIWPDLKKYYYELKPEEKNGSELESRLLGNILKTRSLMAKYVTLKPYDQIDGDVHKKLSSRYDELGKDIANIEKAKLEYKNVQSAIEKGLGKYIDFPESPSEREQHYGFKKEFYDLPKDQQMLIMAQIAEIAGKNVEVVKAETQAEVLKFANPEEKLKLLTEALGEKGNSYFSGLNKLKTKDPEGAVADFQTYIKQSFSADELKLHKDTIQDAKENIHQIFTEKLNVLDELFHDVEELKYSHAGSDFVGRATLKPTENAVVTAIEQDIAAFRKEVNEGKVDNFNERFGQLKKNAQTELEKWKKDWGDTDIITLLDKLNNASHEKDPEKRKEAFTEFAKVARDSQGYKLARKYLDYALEEDYKRASKGLNRDDVLKKMLGEPSFIKNLEDESTKQYYAIIKENPELQGITMQVVKDRLLKRALDSRYKDELRRNMTGDAGTDPVIELYNNWFPLEKSEYHNYKPWEYGAQEWDEFGIDCLKFAGETVPTLGIGIGAGLAGKVGGRLGGRLVGKYLVRMGLMETEIALLEQGGITALKQSFKSGKALSYGASRLLGTVAFEGAAMYGLGSGLEYLQTGQVADFSSPGKVGMGLAESMAKATVFKIIGLAQRIRPLAIAMEKGGATKVGAWLASETLSGVAGAELDQMLAKWKGLEFTNQDYFKSVLQNYLVSVGMGMAHSKGDIGKKATKKMTDAYFKENLDAAGIKVPADIVAVKDGKIYTKEGKEIHVTDPSLLPPSLKARYEELGGGQKAKPDSTDPVIAKAVESANKAQDAAKKARAKANEAKKKGWPNASKLEKIAIKLEKIASKLEEIATTKKIKLNQANHDLSVKKLESEFSQEISAIQNPVLKELAIENISIRESSKENSKKTTADFQKFEELLSAKDPSALEAYNKFNHALANKDNILLDTIKAEHPEWARAFENIQNRALETDANLNISALKVSDDVLLNYKKDKSEDKVEAYLETLSQNANDAQGQSVLDRALVYAWKGKFPVETLYSAVKSGKIVAGPLLVDVLISHNSVEVASNEKIPLTPQQQVKLIHYFTVDELKTNIEKGRIDPSRPEVIDRIMRDTNKKQQLGEILIAEGKAPVTENHLNGLLTDRMNDSGLQTIAQGIESGAFKLDPQLNKEKVLKQIQQEFEMRKDNKELKKMQADPEKLDAFKELFAETAKKIKNNEPVSNDIVDLLNRLKQRDPAGYELVLNSDHNRLLSTECMNGIFLGNKVEFISHDGSKSSFLSR